MLAYHIASGARTIRPGTAFDRLHQEIRPLPCRWQLTFQHDPTESPQQRIAAGEVAERPIAPVLKTGVPVRVPRVRIPASPLSREGVPKTPSLALLSPQWVSNPPPYFAATSGVVTDEVIMDYIRQLEGTEPKHVGDDFRVTGS